jgi:hypothetical protein
LFLLDGRARVSVYSSQGKQVSFRDIRPWHFRRDGGDRQGAALGLDQAIGDCAVAAAAGGVHRGAQQLSAADARGAAASDRARSGC